MRPTGGVVLGLAACSSAPADGEWSAVWPEARTGLGPEQVAVVVNADDPLSADIAAAWAGARGVPGDRIVTVALGTADVLDPEDFAVAATALDDLPDEVQALALAFRQPYRVGCMGVSAAFALGFDPSFCNQTTGVCGPTARSPLYDEALERPWSSAGVRPTMMLGARTAEEAVALASRGLAADGSFPGGSVHLVRTPDIDRSVRWHDFQGTPGRFDPEHGLWVEADDLSTGDGLLRGLDGVFGYQTGLATVEALDTVFFQPGALADHLTSFGGDPSGSSGQMPATDWLDAGATASYGTAVEPCNYEEKFPRASVLWPSYYRGATAVEAYWRSVEWPGEGNFVGDPLARPFGHRVERERDTLVVTTTWLPAGAEVQLQGADGEDGPWKVVERHLSSGDGLGEITVRVPDDHAFLRLVVTEVAQDRTATTPFP